MRTKVYGFKSFMDGSYKEPIVYYGDTWQKVAWLILTPIITLWGIEIALMLCEMLMHMTATGF
jgi:hypothetical protein